MRKYDDAITLESTVQQIGGWLNQDGLRRALRDIDARLSALEAAQKKPDAPTPEQREPGWYPVWETADRPTNWRWTGELWELGQIAATKAFFEKTKIGPRIQEPGQ